LATATLTGFTSDGTLGSTTIMGDVTGSFPAPVIMTNDQTFNDYLQTFTYGTQMSFDVTLASAPNPLVPIDTTFSFFLYDANGNPISNANSPSGEAFDININGQTGAETLVPYFPPPPITIKGTIPEPSSVLQLGAGLGALVGWSRRRRRGR
jgi:hypothetical protein